MAKNLHVEESLLKIGFILLSQITAFQPFSSISFLNTAEIQLAVRETKRLTDWGMAKNKPKMKESGLEVLGWIETVPEGDPVNLNLDEYQLNSLAEINLLLERALANQLERLEMG